MSNSAAPLLLLVAPDRLFRETLSARLTSAEFEVGQSAAEIHEIRKELLQDPHVVLIVHAVPTHHGALLDMLRDLKRNCPEIKLLVLGMGSSPGIVSALLEIGVNTILDESVSFDTFLNYLRFIALDEQTLPAVMVSEVLRKVRPYSNSNDRPSSIPVDLSTREKLVLAYLIEGASNKEIARYLGLADGTIKVAVKAILRKINANNRTQAAIWALQHEIRDHVIIDEAERRAAPYRPSSASARESASYAMA